MTSKPEPRGVVHNGSETYSAGMENSRKVVRTFIKQVLECVEFLLEEDRIRSTVCIAEFGSADGGVSLELMDTLIDHITKLVDDHTEVLLVYEDQLLNDYNVLFRTVHTESSNFPSEFQSKENVHVLASATSMYKKCLPTGFVDLAFSSMSNQWLSEMPCHIRAGIFQSDCDTEELEAYRQQWKKDWKQFLMCRAQELRLGGYLVVVSFVTDAEGRLNDHVGENSFQFFTSIWKEFEQSSKITQEEFLQTTSSTYTPSETELLEPFHDNMQTNLHLVNHTRKEWNYHLAYLVMQV
ncbi:uncharacterized protein [Argopecten irradians]|uniref:uncharacterized protein isoform X2 n=1 Tax=Argopecten irradians TaxID=31199 RepID=UPI0037145884